jgi:hypothetical protein
LGHTLTTNFILSSSAKIEVTFDTDRAVLLYGAANDAEIISDNFTYSPETKSLGKSFDNVFWKKYFKSEELVPSVRRATIDEE